ncbi:MAG: hypothetical protein ACLQLC_14150, partial [Candidatus Sulfotelmatobacter sp.]
MSSIFPIGFLALSLGLPLFAATDATLDAPIISCGNGVPGGINCLPTKKNIKEAFHAYHDGLKLEDQNRLEDSFAKFSEASNLVPRDLTFLSARETTKAQLVFQHTQRGDAFLAAANTPLAAAEYRAALNLDPDN